jgi:hypothetical protein
MPRNRTHLPELAPGCTVSGDTAAFDRFVLRLDNTDVAWTKSLAEQVICRLSGNPALRRGRQPATVAVEGRLSRLSGRISFEGGVPSKATIELRLNLTEFLARNFESLSTPEALRGLHQEARRAYLTTRHNDPVALDGKANFFTDRQQRSGSRLDHAAWFAPYVEMVLAFLAGELNAVASGLGADHQIPRLIFPLRNWSLRQLEVYWEFWNSDAVGRAADLCRLVPVVTQSHRLTRYTLSEERSGMVLGISARTSHRHIVHKIYSKLLDRVRLEIGYERSLRRTERGLSLRGPTDWFELEPVVREAANLAAARANSWLGAIWEIDEDPTTARGFSTAASFLVALANAFPDPSVHLMVWNHLLHSGSIPRRAFQLNAGEGVLLLVRRGFLVPNRPGRARMNTTYRPADAFSGVVTALRTAYSPTLQQLNNDMSEEAFSTAVLTTAAEEDPAS